MTSEFFEVGIECPLDVGDTVTFQRSGEDYTIFICTVNPSDAFTVENVTFQLATINSDDMTTKEYKILGMNKITADSWEAVAWETTDWHQISHDVAGPHKTLINLDDGALFLPTGSYLAVCVHTVCDYADDCSVGIAGDIVDNEQGRMSAFDTWAEVIDGDSIYGVIGPVSIYGWTFDEGGSGIGGPIKYTCHTETGVWRTNYVLEDTWGYIKPTWFRTSGGLARVDCTVAAPWETGGSYTSGVTFYDEVAKDIVNPNDPYEHWVVTLYLAYFTPQWMVWKYTECWYRLNPNGDVYVKEGGSDSAYGVNWDQAYATIAKGFDEVTDGAKIFVEEGMYQETLANLDPNAGTTAYMVPMADSHVQVEEAVVVVDSGSKASEGYTRAGGYSTLYVSSSVPYMTVLNDGLTMPSEIVQLADVECYADGACTFEVRVLHLRPTEPNQYFPYYGYAVIERTEVRKTVTVTEAGEFSVHNIFVGIALPPFGDFFALEFHYLSGAGQAGPKVDTAEAGDSESYAGYIDGIIQQSSFADQNGIEMNFRYFS